MAPHEKDLGHFQREFKALADEAAQFGIQACVLLSADDPIARTSQFSEIFQGNRMIKIGMLQQALWYTEQTG